MGSLEDLERKVSFPLDPEREIWEGSRYRFVRDKGQIIRARRVHGGSFMAPIPTDLIYANVKSGTIKNTFTTEVTINDTAGMDSQPELPPYFWQPLYGVGKSLRVVIRGMIWSTATPTFTFSVRLGGQAAINGPLVLGTTTLTTLTGISTKLWELEGDLVVRLIGATGANTTGQGMGLLSSPGGLASPGVYEAWGNAVQPGTVSPNIDTSIANYINMNVACSASSASNQVQVLQMLIVGLN